MSDLFTFYYIYIKTMTSEELEKMMTDLHSTIFILKLFAS